PCRRSSQCWRRKTRSNTKELIHCRRRSSIVSSSRFSLTIQPKKTNVKCLHDGTLVSIRSDWTRSTYGHSKIHTRFRFAVRKLPKHEWSRAFSIMLSTLFVARVRIHLSTTAQARGRQLDYCSVQKRSPRFVAAIL